MLTIGTPISLTADPSILTVTDNFGSRITDNYCQITSDIESTDMLHFISSPPEVYIGEGGMTSLVDSQNITNNQQMKVNIINSVLNRILVSDTYEMTYQDRVFISNMLRKMGVADINTFIRQVNELKEETQNLNELIDIYWNGGDTLAEYKTYVEEQKAQRGEKQEEEKAQNAEFYLHQEIFNRLKTGAVYQELQTFASSHYNHSEIITSDEIVLGEQNMVAQNILLNKLQNYYSFEEAPMEYNRLNIYELGDVSESVNRTDNINSELISAVLLNTLNELYALRYSDLIRNSNSWFKIDNAIYEVAYNTFERFNNYHNKLNISRAATEQYNTMLNESRINEINALNKFFDESEQTVSDVTTYLDNSTEMTMLDEKELEEASERMDPTQLLNYVNQMAQQNVRHNQQIIHITDEEKLLKAQMDFFNQKNVENRQKIYEKIQNNEINVNMSETEAINQLLMESINNPPEFSLEYLMQAQNMTPEEMGIEFVQSRQEAENQIVENLIKKTDRKVRNIIESTYTDVELTHKQEETNISEEMLEEIRNITTQKTVKEEKTVENITHTDTIREIVTNQVNDMQVKTTQELQDLVSRDVASRMDGIYDKVYSKLEKKMESERRRRGL